MTDYTPRYGEPQHLTYTAGGAITAGQMLEVTAARTVTPTTGATSAFAGIAGHDAALGAQVTVLAGAGIIHETATTAVAVAAGDLIVSAADGKAAGAGAPGSELGVAVTAVDGAGGIIRWKTTRG